MFSYLPPLPATAQSLRGHFLRQPAEKRSGMFDCLRGKFVPGFFIDFEKSIGHKFLQLAFSSLKTGGVLHQLAEGGGSILVQYFLRIIFFRCYSGNKDDAAIPKKV
jgi:hypothetical protein